MAAVSFWGRKFKTTSTVSYRINIADCRRAFLSWNLFAKYHLDFVPDVSTASRRKVGALCALCIVVMRLLRLVSAKPKIPFSGLAQASSRCTGSLFSRLNKGREYDCRVANFRGPFAKFQEKSLVLTSVDPSDSS